MDAVERSANGDMPGDVSTGLAGRLEAGNPVADATEDVLEEMSEPELRLIARSAIRDEARAAADLKRALDQAR